MRLIRVFSLAFIAVASIASAQNTQGKKKSSEPKTPKPADTVLAKFFETETPITATFTVNAGKIRGDKNADTAPWRDAMLTYTADSGTVRVPVKAKTRGIWRLKNCQFPPIRLNFANDSTKHTVFHGLDKPKLVNHCRDDDGYEQYVLQEFQLYRVYRLLNPASHAVRLLRLTYVDSASKKVLATRYAFIAEEPAMLAARLHASQTKITGAGPGDIEPFHGVLASVFQYMIGNTDWAVSALHNVELIQLPTGEYWPVVYDFDFSGAVNARYATADPRLHLRTVRERLYRGYCVTDPGVYPEVYKIFNAKKDSIYALYRDPLGKLLKPDVVDETLKYFDDFYKVINEPRLAKMNIMEACMGKR
jgi:hypothetical protein